MTERLDPRRQMRIEKLPQTESPDPTKTSVYAPSVEPYKQVGVNDSGRATYEDVHGRRFHKIIESVADQMFLSRLLKGIVAVSDIIQVPQSFTFLSYEMPLEDIGPNNDKLAASNQILRLLFGDLDHDLDDHNVRRNDHSHAFFDFAQFSDLDIDSAARERDARARIENHAANIAESERSMLDRMLQTLHDRLAGAGGHAFIEAILADIKKNGGGSPVIFLRRRARADESITAFQNVILRRIDFARKALDRSADVKPR